MPTYKDLIVWQKSFELTFLVYEVTATFPSEERYALLPQMRRCAVSIPSNIAEGKMRFSRNEFSKFLKIAFASGAELETQSMIAKRLGYGKDAQWKAIDAILGEVMRMLNKMLGSAASS